MQCLQVLRCFDHKMGCDVAVKIIRNKKRFHHQALVEVKILEHLRHKVSTCCVEGQSAQALRALPF